MERKLLPARRRSELIKRHVGGMTVYVNLGYYEDGSIGEIFIDCAREGTQMREMMHGFAKLISLCLQYSIPIERVIDIVADSSPNTIPSVVAEILAQEAK